MISSTIASEIAEPYAQALMALAQEQSLTDRFGQDASALMELMAASSDLQPFLANPLMGAAPKKGVLQQLGAGFHPLFVNFLKLLVDKGRIVFLPAVLSAYQSLLRQLNQAVLAEVTATVELTEEQQSSLRRQVIAMTNAQQVDLSITVDPELLGGVIIQVGSQVIDASLKGQLRRLGVQLAAAA
ncbi:MAG: F0F1 ATP synthase subunit delta [Leptolyngbya sp. RL_3_1]|nr:F0F1 ATP synthase subunit delta [Leptolyngbya sp. RL_3_1]